MRIGVLGGTFDPVHAGHLKLALAAFSQLNLNKVVFVPSRQNPLKPKAPATPSAVRVRLLRSAIWSYPFFEVSGCELRRKGRSFTVDTLKYFKRKHGSRAVLYFLAGADTARDLRRWRSFDRIRKLSRFVVATRPGFRAARLPAGVLSMPFDALDVSSTRIRRSSSKDRR